MGIGLAKTAPTCLISFGCTHLKWNHLVLNVSNRELASIQIRELISSGTTLFEMKVITMYLVKKYGMAWLAFAGPMQHHLA